MIAFLLGLLLATTAQAQPAAKAAYRCLPCGGACDKDTYSAEGSCPHCGMQLVRAASIRFGTVPAAGICAYIRKHPNALLLDVRTRAEFEGKADPDFGTLKGAINIPLQELPKRLKELDTYRKKEILVFCSHSHRSPQAAYLLMQNGFVNVTNMAGGMSVVTDAGCKR